MKKLIATFMIATATLAWAGMTVANNVPVYSQNDSVIMVSPTQPQFVLKLPANPTTGYIWATDTYDASVLKVLNHKFTRNSARIGAPGTDVWTFSVNTDALAKAKETTLTLKYARPWEKNPPAATKSYTIKMSE